MSSDAFFAATRPKETKQRPGFGVTPDPWARPISVQWLTDRGWRERQYPAGNYWPRAEADGLGSRIAFPMPGRLVTIPFQPGIGPGEPVDYPFPFPAEYQPGNQDEMQSGGGLLWWAHGQHPGDPRISRVMALRVSDRGPLQLWQGPLLRDAWRVDLARGDLDGSPLREVFVVRYGRGGYAGFDVYSDSVTPWGRPVLGPSPRP